MCGAGMMRARLHLCVDLGEGLRELGLEAADLRLHRVEDVLVHLEGGCGVGIWGVNGGVKGWRWRCEGWSFTSSLWLVSSQKTIWTIVWSAGSASNPSDMSEPRDLVERSGAERRECRCEG